MSTPAITEVKRAALDVVGVMIAGSAERSASVVREYVVAQATDGVASIAGGDRRSSAPLAALANGTAAHALDFDDLGLNMGHPSAAILPAALAAGEQVGATGRDLVTAMAVGYEVAGRLAGIYPTSLDGPFRRGYHGTSFYGVFGATAAAAWLFALDAQQTRHAFGIAASQAGGLRANFGSMTKPFHAGMSCRAGVEAAQLAASGFTANSNILEDRFGWFDVLCAGEGRLDDVVDGLGGTLLIESGLTFKLAPTSAGCQYAVDAGLRLVAENDLGPDEFQRADVVMPAQIVEEVLPCAWPASGLEGKFCIAYNVASVLVDGAVTLASFSEDSLRRLGPYRNRIGVVGDANRSGPGARLLVRTGDGRDIVVDLEHAPQHGTPDDPVTWEELSAKFRANVAEFVREAAVDLAIERFAMLETQPSLHGITGLIDR